MGHTPPRLAKSHAPRDAELTPLPLANQSGTDARVVDAWCEWLGALAKDAEAALAAAMAYKELDGPSRDTWIGALEHDAARVSVPKIAVYAPLLAVETDPARRARITDAIGPADASASPRGEARALCGKARDGTRVAAIVLPLYLEFVVSPGSGTIPSSIRAARRWPASTSPGSYWRTRRSSRWSTSSRWRFSLTTEADASYPRRCACSPICSDRAAASHPHQPEPPGGCRAPGKPCSPPGWG
jgi:hypothetical protein